MKIKLVNTSKIFRTVPGPSEALYKGYLLLPFIESCISQGEQYLAPKLTEATTPWKALEKGYAGISLVRCVGILKWGGATSQ